MSLLLEQYEERGYWNDDRGGNRSQRRLPDPLKNPLHRHQTEFLGVVPGQLGVNDDIFALVGV